MVKGIGIRTISPCSSTVPILVVQRIVPESERAFRGCEKILAQRVLRLHDKQHDMGSGGKRHRDFDSAARLDFGLTLHCGLTGMARHEISFQFISLY